MANELRYTLTLKDLFSRQMNGAISSTEKLDNKVNSLSANIGGRLAGAIAGLSVIGLGREMLDVGASFERAEIGLKTLLHSSVLAKNVFEDLKAESVKSPFSFETLLQGNRLLISAGVSADQAKKDFFGLSNAMAAVGGDEDALSRMAINLQQIKNTGRATALDIKQFGFAGINMFDLLSKHAQKHNLVLDMEKVSYEQITAALNEAGAAGGRWFGATDNLVNSTSGRLSNLKDSFKNTLYDIFVKLSPAINATVEGITTFFNAIRNNLALIVSIGKAIGTMVLALYAYKTITATLAAVEMAKFAIAMITTATAIEGTPLATLVLNSAMLLNPIGVVIGLVATLVIGWNLYADSLERAEALHQETFAKNTKINAINEEINKVKELRGEYEKQGLSKQDAWKKTLKERLEAKGSAIAMVEQMAKEEPLLEKKKVLESKLGVLYEQQKYLNKLGSPFGITTDTISSLDKKGNKIAEPNKPASLGTGTSVTAARPQDLTINITKLVENLNIKAENLKDSAIQIKEAIAKALIEAVNDVNTVTR